jgi:putative MATE family efflux protein
MSHESPPNRRLAGQYDLTKGSIAGNLWALSWPMLITNTLNTLGPAIDMVWVGRLGTASIAGVGVSGIVLMVINSLILGIFTGTTAMIARSVGAGDEKMANRISQQAFVIGAAVSVIIAAIGILFTRPILLLLGIEEAVVDEGTAYMRIQLIGIVTMAAVQVFQSIMQASGDSITPMKISIGFRILQILLCPALVFGFWIFPKLGVSGAALSNIIAQSAGGVVGLWILFSGRTRIRVSFHDFAIEWGLIWRAVRIGLPASLTNMERSLAELLLVRLITPFGTIAVAAHSLAQRVDGFVQVLGGGLGSASGVLVGQNLGAKEPGRAAKTAWTASAYATGISLVCSIIIWFWAEELVHFFSADISLVQLTSTFLRIQIVAYLVWGLVVCLSLSLNGAGDTIVPMLANLITMLGVQLILGYYLSRNTDLGVNGLRWGIVIAMIIRALIYVTYFRTGRWKYKRI